MVQEKPRSAAHRRLDDRSARRSMVAYVLYPHLEPWRRPETLIVPDAIDVEAERRDARETPRCLVRHAKMPARSAYTLKQKSVCPFRRGEGGACRDQHQKH